MSLRANVFGMVLTAVVVLVGAAHSFGQTNSVTDGNWSSPATWDNGEPTSTSAAIINGSDTVTIDSSGETTNLLDIGTISGQTGTLNMISGDLFVDDTDTVTAPNTPSIRVGQAAGSTGNFTMSGGSVFIVGASPSDFGIGELIVGDLGTGTFSMSAGDMTASDEIVIGLAEGSSGEVNVSGGTFATQGRSILVGFDGAGELNVSGTGSVTANFDILAGFIEGSSATMTLSGGTIETGFLFTNFLSDGAGSTFNMTQTGGTLNARIAVVLGQGAGTSTFTHSGGVINALTNNGDFVVSDSFDPGRPNTSTYNISGTAEVNLLHNFIVAAFGDATGIVNQTGGTIVAADNVFVGRDFVGTWNISGGSVTATQFDIVLANIFDASNGTVNQTGGTVTAGRNLVVGRDGTGLYNVNGGTVNAANVFLGDFDTSTGTMKITSGTVNVTGNFSVGGALASNAAPDRVEPTGANGPQGQALDANGVLIVSGSAATIDVGGNFLANADDKSSFREDPFITGADNTSTLVFEIFNGSGTSLIDVAGIADLDGAVIDLDLMSFTPATGTIFNLLEAASFGTTGLGTTENVGTGEGFSLAAEDVGIFSLAVVAGGGVETLRATFLGAAVQPGDHNKDGKVDAADYVAWRKNPGAFGGDPAGYNAFRENFGEVSPGAGGGQAVPEPATWVMSIVGAVLGLYRRQGR